MTFLYRQYNENDISTRRSFKFKERNAALTKAQKSLYYGKGLSPRNLDDSFLSTFSFSKGHKLNKNISRCESFYQYLFIQYINSPAPIKLEKQKSANKSQVNRGTLKRSARKSRIEMVINGNGYKKLKNLESC